MNNWEKYKATLDIPDTESEIEKKLLEDLLHRRNLHLFGSNIEDENFFYSTLANAFRVKEEEIIVVGSAKLGFSLKNGKDFDSIFLQTKEIKDKSDVDISIVSTKLFFEIMKDCWKITKSYRDHYKWTRRGSQYACEFCKHPVESHINELSKVNLNGLVCERHVQINKPSIRKLRNDKIAFLQYLASGWYRQDLAPKEYQIEGIDKCMETLNDKFEREFSYAIYADFEFLAQYQLIGIQSFLKRHLNV